MPSMVGLTLEVVAPFDHKYPPPPLAESSAGLLQVAGLATMLAWGELLAATLTAAVAVHRLVLVTVTV